MFTLEKSQAAGVFSVGSGIWGGLTLRYTVRDAMELMGGKIRGFNWISIAWVCELLTFFRQKNAALSFFVSGESFGVFFCEILLTPANSGDIWRWIHSTLDGLMDAFQEALQLVQSRVGYPI